MPAVPRGDDRADECDPQRQMLRELDGARDTGARRGAQQQVGDRQQHHAEQRARADDRLEALERKEAEARRRGQLTVYDGTHRDSP